MAALVGLTAVLAMLAVTSRGMAEGLDIYWVDVEGGAATLIVTPAGETLLVDTGHPGRRDPDRITNVVTEVAGRKSIDHLVVTHYHIDHFGGAATLAQMLPIGTVYDNGEFPEMPERPDPVYREFSCRERKVIHPGDELPLRQAAGTTLKVRCLGTRQEFPGNEDAAENTDICAGSRPKDRDGSDNANSIVLLVEYGPFRFFDAGDLTWNQEYKLVCPRDLVGTVDVYQVTHHGLDASNNPLVLQTLRPTVAVMNNGARKGCMPEVFETLKNTASLEAIYQMHKNERPDGAVNNVADEFIANLESPCQGNYIHLHVEPDGATYTVRIPANGHQRTFTTRRRL